MSTKLRHTFFSICLLIILIPGCSERFVNPEISDNPEGIFELIWSEFDRYYPFFDDKNIDWDSVYSVFKPLISNNMSDEMLFQVLSDMLETLRDGHVNIYAPFGTYSYTGWYDQYPANYYNFIITNRYLQGSGIITGGGNIQYGIFSSVGYVRINSFSGNGNWAESIDEVLEYFSELDGIIVDVRHNGGGSGRDANRIASRFADRERLYSYIQYRNGPQRRDFTDLMARTVAPGGKQQFIKPVILLTNRSTFSASEDFALMMREFPHVTHIGDTTGGGLGNPVFRELTNGWAYRLPIWRQVTADTSKIEGVGIIPHESIMFTDLNIQMQIDPMINRAIAIIRNPE